MIDSLYELNIYRATIIRHVDADTSWVMIDCGFDVSVKLSLRWAGINAPERNTVEGKEALAYLRQILPEGSSVYLFTEKDKREKYGRYLGTLVYQGVNMNQKMIDDGYAQPYP